MTFPGFPGVPSFFQVFQVFQVEWEPWTSSAFLKLHWITYLDSEKEISPFASQLLVLDMKHTCQCLVKKFQNVPSV